MDGSGQVGGGGGGVHDGGVGHQGGHQDEQGQGQGKEFRVKAVIILVLKVFGEVIDVV